MLPDSSKSADRGHWSIYLASIYVRHENRVSKCDVKLHNLFFLYVTEIALLKVTLLNYAGVSGYDRKEGEVRFTLITVVEKNIY